MGNDEANKSEEPKEVVPEAPKETDEPQPAQNDASNGEDNAQEAQEATAYSTANVNDEGDGDSEEAPQN